MFIIFICFIMCSISRFACKIDNFFFTVAAKFSLRACRINRFANETSTQFLKLYEWIAVNELPFQLSLSGCLIIRAIVSLFLSLSFFIYIYPFFKNSLYFFTIDVASLNQVMIECCIDSFSWLLFIQYVSVIRLLLAHSGIARIQKLHNVKLYRFYRYLNEKYLFCTFEVIVTT